MWHICQLKLPGCRAAELYPPADSAWQIEAWQYKAKSGTHCEPHYEAALSMRLVLVLVIGGSAMLTASAVRQAGSSAVDVAAEVDRPNDDVPPSPVEVQ